MSVDVCCMTTASQFPASIYRSGLSLPKRAQDRINHVNSRDDIHRIRFSIHRHAIPFDQAMALVPYLCGQLAFVLYVTFDSDNFLFDTC